MWLVTVAAASVFIYYVLQSLDDSKSDRNRVPRASSGKRIATYFFILLLTTIMMYLFKQTPAEPSVSISGGKMPVPTVGTVPKMDKQLLETHMIRSIRQDVQVGGAPF